jgi:hypothetical protein
VLQRLANNRVIWISFTAIASSVTKRRHFQFALLLRTHFLQMLANSGASLHGVTNLFYGALNHVSDNLDGLVLANALSSCDCLAFYRRVPLRLDQEDTIGESEIQATDLS